MKKRIELGCAGHFIGARSCLFRRHTQVGNYRISTVGDYFPTDKGGREEIGLRRFFETRVFRTADWPDENNEGCGCRRVVDYREVDFEGYQTAGEAQAGHERMVMKYMEGEDDSE